MILQESNYNPLHKIFPIIKEDVKSLSNGELVFITTELTKGGVRAQSPSELQTLLLMLVQLKREAYGQI